MDEVTEHVNEYNGLGPQAVANAAEQAIEQGFEVVRSNERRLLLDLDDQPAVEAYCRVRPLLSEHFGFTTSTTWASKSGKGSHVVIELERPLPFITRIALQAALGSDGKRELLSIIRMYHGCEEPSMLFKPKAAQC